MMNGSQHVQASNLAVSAMFLPCRFSDRCRKASPLLVPLMLMVNDIDLVLLATCTPSTMVANTASLVQKNIGAVGAAAMDTNAACSGFLYALQAATAQIRAGMIKKAVVIAAERMTWYINWARRDSAVLFGDGAGAVVLEASDTPSGLLATKTGVTVKIAISCTSKTLVAI